MKKIAKTAKDPNSDKKPKSQNNPESYLKQPISWQFGLMDYEFDFGWNEVIGRIDFNLSIKENLLENLVEQECDEELFDTIAKIEPSDFKTINDFITKLSAIHSIKTSDIICILKALNRNFFWNYLVPKLKNIESTKWHEFEKETFGRNNKSKHHWVKVTDLIKKAQHRLCELKLDDYEELYSIRLTGTQRIWGIRFQNYYKLLWFDFNHSICPSLKE